MLSPGDFIFNYRYQYNHIPTTSTGLRRFHKDSNNQCIPD